MRASGDASLPWWEGVVQRVELQMLLFRLGHDFDLRRNGTCTFHEGAAWLGVRGRVPQVPVLSCLLLVVERAVDVVVRFSARHGGSDSQ